MTPYCKPSVLQENYGIEKTFGWRREWNGVSGFSVENLLSHSTGELRRVTVLCDQKKFGVG